MSLWFRYTLPVGISEESGPRKRINPEKGEQMMYEVIFNMLRNSQGRLTSLQTHFINIQTLPML